ncbi:hypothetical protein Mic7113_4983 [Allocoleopsis franciscana PCC 7113]|uniref:Uncharacterized protein n=1 Tax=Allocoleopsis franciscana PCC 7113 TaxID=1173027 RepID=K9WLJ7_9CYAN|nr:hypothetical protein Mic7113_4983 [Allocoleopsis franciscana PCC 7113]
MSGLSKLSVAKAKFTPLMAQTRLPLQSDEFLELNEQNKAVAKSTKN